MRRAALARRYTSNDVRSILNHLSGMERTFFAGNALHHQARISIDKNAHLLGGESRFLNAKSTAERVRSITICPVHAKWLSLKPFAVRAH